MTNEKKTSNRSHFQPIRFNTIRIMPLLFFQIAEQFYKRHSSGNSFDSISSMPHKINFLASNVYKELTGQRRTSHILAAYFVWHRSIECFCTLVIAQLLVVLFNSVPFTTADDYVLGMDALKKKEKQILYKATHDFTLCVAFINLCLSQVSIELFGSTVIYYHQQQYEKGVSLFTNFTFFFCFFTKPFWKFIKPLSLNLLFSIDLSTELTMNQRLAEFQIRLQYFESMYRTRQEDVAILSQYISIPSPNDGNITISGPLLDALSPETRSMLRNLSVAPRFPQSLRLPTAFQFLPHLLDDPSKWKIRSTLIFTQYSNLN